MARALAPLRASRRVLSYGSPTMDQRAGSSEISSQATLHVGRSAPQESKPFGPPPDWLASAVDAVLNDIGVADLTPTYRPEAEPPRFGVVYLEVPDGGFGFGVTHGESRAELIVALAEGIQEHLPEVKSHWGCALPPCPGHPHPAKPAIRDGAAWWTCPREHNYIAPIGKYAPSTRRSR